MHTLDKHQIVGNHRTVNRPTLQISEVQQIRSNHTFDQAVQIREVGDTAAKWPKDARLNFDLL